jgi:hypothetical protein
MWCTTCCKDRDYNVHDPGHVLDYNLLHHKVPVPHGIRKVVAGLVTIMMTTMGIVEQMIMKNESMKASRTNPLPFIKESENKKIFLFLLVGM